MPCLNSHHPQIEQAPGHATLQVTMSSRAPLPATAVQMFLATAPCKVRVHAPSKSLTHRDTLGSLSPLSRHHLRGICICDNHSGFIYPIYEIGTTTPTS